MSSCENKCTVNTHKHGLSMCRGPFLLLVLFSCQILCNSMDYNMLGSSVLHCLPEFAQIHVYLVKGMVFHHVWMWELDYKESWVQKNWCFWTVVLEKTLESPLDYKEIQPIHPKGVQSWVFIGRTDFEAEAPILWPPDVKLTHLKSPWCWERLRGGGEGDNRGWDGWIASPTQWTWVWVNCGELVMDREVGMLQSMGSQRVGHDWATELND